MSYKYLFGPVLSRRLGVSLGVDMVPHKYCTMNCIYCEVGKTTNLLKERDEYIPVQGIITELKDYLSNNPEPDYITFSGAGEPTLNSGIGEVVRFIKDNFTREKIALITNASLLSDPQLRSEIVDIDLIMPSLDAVSDDVYNLINRPCTGISIDDIIEGLISFRKESESQMWLEVFIISGVNDNEDELSLLKKAISKINPDRVQLNSLDRPGTESSVNKVTLEELERIAAKLDTNKVDIISRTAKSIKNVDKKINSETSDEDQALIETRIIATVSRRPCTAEELALILNCRSERIQKVIAKMEKNGVLSSAEKERGRFYRKAK